MNFDTTSWFTDIKSITVYKDGQCVVESTSIDNNTMFASIVWSCGKEYGVNSVRVVDMDGVIQAVYPTN